nr:hypothetical protein [Tanacetum cinerariifolium]
MLENTLEYLRNDVYSVDPLSPGVIAPITEVVALEPAESIGLPSSTTVDQDAPSLSNSQTSPKTQSPIISNDVEEENYDLDVALMNNDSFFGIPISKNDSLSSSLDVIPTVVHTATPNSEHVTKWTKDHPLDNIIDKLERPVSIRLKFHEQAYFVTTMLSSHPLDAIQIFLAFAAHMNMIVYQMDVEIAFLNNILREEVYISQLDGCMDKDNPNHVYKLKKALYGLKQASRAWFDLLLKFLLSQEFSKGTVDPILFIRRQGKDILLFKIIFEKYGMESSDPVNTPMVEKSILDEDPQGKAFKPTHYHGMVGTLMYITTSRPDLTFAVCMCARAIALCCNNVQHSQSKHIDIRFYFIKEQVEIGVVELYSVNTEYQPADIFTKALGRERIEFLINKLGMRSFTLKTMKQLVDEAKE